MFLHFGMIALTDDLKEGLCTGNSLLSFFIGHNVCQLIDRIPQSKANFIGAH
jgi:hypothetical protein